MKVYQLKRVLDQYDPELDVVIEHPAGGISNVELSLIKIDYNISVMEKGADHALVPKGVGTYGSKSIRNAIIVHSDDFNLD